MDYLGFEPTQLTIPFMDLASVDVPRAIKLSGKSRRFKTTDEILGYKDSTLLFMRMAVSHTSKNEMPIVRPYKGPVPTIIVGMHRVSAHGPYSVVPHFYFDDTRILRFWNNPFHTADILRRFPASIGIDLSMTNDMVHPQKFYSSYLNKLWVAWLQSRGLAVIPNISFSDEWEADYWIEGWPKHSVIAISSVGVITHGEPEEWLKAVDRIRRELLPLHIIRYGPMISGEKTVDCSYFPNDNKRFANGRKLFI